jgi:hypothetical protein
MIDGFPLSFFLPLVVHALAGLTTAVLGAITFSRPKRSERHPRWGARYLWAYTVVFLTAIILSVQHWPADAYLVVLATIGYGFALGGYGARRFREEPWLRRVLGDQWISAHIVGMIGSYVVLWTAFYVDNGHLIPLVKSLPTLALWVVPTLIALPFLVISLSRFMPTTALPVWRGSASLREEHDDFTSTNAANRHVVSAQHWGDAGAAHDPISVWDDTQSVYHPPIDTPRNR